MGISAILINGCNKPKIIDNISKNGCNAVTTIFMICPSMPPIMSNIGVSKPII